MNWTPEALRCNGLKIRRFRVAPKVAPEAPGCHRISSHSAIIRRRTPPFLGLAKLNRHCFGLVLNEPSSILSHVTVHSSPQVDRGASCWLRRGSKRLDSIRREVHEGIALRAVLLMKDARDRCVVIHLHLNVAALCCRARHGQPSREGLHSLTRFKGNQLPHLFVLAIEGRHLRKHLHFHLLKLLIITGFRDVILRHA